MTRMHTIRQLVVWLLVIALPVHGVSSTLVQFLGATHRHAMQPGDTLASLSDGASSVLRAIVGDGAMEVIRAFHARQHPTLVLQQIDFAQHQHHDHTHTQFERHIHNPADGSVIVLGEKATGDDASGGLHASSLDGVGVLMPETFFLPALLSAALTWPRCDDDRWRSHVAARLERPPCGHDSALHVRADRIDQ